MKKLLLGVVLGSGLVFGITAYAGIEWQPNPLFDPLPVGKDGLSLVSYTQEQKDMTMLYGKLEYLEYLIKNSCGK